MRLISAGSKVQILSGPRPFTPAVSHLENTEPVILFGRRDGHGRRVNLEARATAVAPAESSKQCLPSYRGQLRQTWAIFATHLKLTIADRATERPRRAHHEKTCRHRGGDECQELDDSIGQECNIQPCSQRDESENNCTLVEGDSPAPAAILGQLRRRGDLALRKLVFPSRSQRFAPSPEIFWILYPLAQQTF